MKTLGMITGIIGGGVCVLGGLLCLIVGVNAALQNGGSTLPPGLYYALGLYFIGKGVFAAGISLNAADRTSGSHQQTSPIR
jgi:hypothetical protein